MKELWPLALLSLLSGIPLSCKIIGESHVSRMPDCPIAHDIDTLLLWPAIPSMAPKVGASTSGTFLPPTIFKVPVAAITEIDKYDVNWDLVMKTYLEAVSYSLIVSVMIVLGIWAIISEDGIQAE